MLTTEKPCNQVKDSPDIAPFAIVVQDHIGWVYSCARRYLGDASLADDAVQAVFMALWRKRKRLAADARPIGGWLLQATCYACNDLRKINRRRDHHERKAAAMRSGQTRLSDEAAESKTEQLLALDAAMQKLSTAERNILVARFFQGHTAREVSEHWQISEAAAEKRTSRAVEKLRQIMARKTFSMDGMAIASLLTSAVGTAPGGLMVKVLQGITGKAALSLTATHAARKIAFHTAHIPAIATAAAVTLAVGVAAIAPVALTAQHPSKNISPAPQAAAAASAAAGKGILICAEYEMLVQKDVARVIKTGGSLISGRPGGVQAYSISSRLVRVLAQARGGRIVLGSRLNWLSRPLPIQLGAGNYAPAPMYQTPVILGLRHTLLRKRVLAQIIVQTNLQWHDRTYRNALRLRVKSTRGSNIVYAYSSNIPIGGANLPYVFEDNMSIPPGRAVVLVRPVMNFQGTRWYSAVVFDVHRYPYRLVPAICDLTDVARYIKLGPSGIQRIASVASAWLHYSLAHPARTLHNDARWTKSLPDRVTVRLERISSNTWPLCRWSPAGMPLGRALQLIPRGKVNVQFSIRASAWPGQTFLGRSIPGPWRGVVSGNGTPYDATCKVGLDSGKWKIIGMAKPAPVPRMGVAFSVPRDFSFMNHRFGVYFSDAPAANRAYISLFSVARAPNMSRHALAVGAIDREGKFIPPTPAWAPSFQCLARFRTNPATAIGEYGSETIPISPSSVKRYVWITRRRHWVTFHGFALQPSPLPSTVYALEQRQSLIRKKAVSSAKPIINIAANQDTPAGLMTLLGRAMQRGTPADLERLAYAPTSAERHLWVAVFKRASAQNAHGLWAAAKKQFGVGQMRRAGLGSFLRKPFTPALPQHWKIKGAYATPIPPLPPGINWPKAGQPLHALIKKNGLWYLDFELTNAQLITVDKIEKITARGNANFSPRSQAYRAVMRQLQTGKIKDAYVLRDALDAALKHFSKPPQ